MSELHAGPLHAVSRTPARGTPAGRLRLLLAALTLVAGPVAGPGVQAQAPAAVSLEGRITGPAGEPLADVVIIVSGTRLTATTRADGSFELRGVPAGRHALQFHRLGYRGSGLEVAFQDGVGVRRDITLDLDPVPVDPIDVRPRPSLATVSPEMQGFLERRERGIGYFYTRIEIEAMQARQLTDVLRRVPGVRIEPSSGPFGSSYNVQMGRSTGVTGFRDCPVLYFVNGTPFAVANDIGINAYIRPDDVAGIEVYSGAARVPAQFASHSRNSRCGVIMIWTHADAGPARRG